MPRRSILCLAGVAAASILIAAAPAKRKPQPGYACTIEHRGDFGVIKADFQIMDSGEPPSAYLQWDAGDGTFKNPWITGAFFRKADGRYALDYGYVSIMWHIWERRPGKRPRPLKLSLELTTDPTYGFASSHMVGAVERSGGPFHIQLGWLDTAALAKGSTKLYLVARNAKHNLVDKVDVDRTIFARAEPHIVDALVEIERMTRRPAEFCAHADDLGTDDIVVT
ncbi:MAG: hypothetical protein JSR79_04335 [Proteobacteria bacterium]|nr:hypothetical protein [Pseudomonadota bacterium]